MAAHPCGYYDTDRYVRNMVQATTPVLQAQAADDVADLQRNAIQLVGYPHPYIAVSNRIGSLQQLSQAQASSLEGLRGRLQQVHNFPHTSRIIQAISRILQPRAVAPPPPPMPLSDVEQRLRQWETTFAAAFPGRRPARVLAQYAPLIAHPDRSELVAFIQRLPEMADYSHTRTRNNVLLLFDNILQSACDNESFRKAFYGLAVQANCSCDDRITLYLCRMEVAWRFTQELPFPQCIELLIGFERLMRLMTHVDLITKERGLGDAIETELFYWTRLREPLQLPFSITSMGHANCAGVTLNDVREAGDLILAATSTREQKARILIQSDHWQQRLATAHAPAMAAIKRVFDTTGNLQEKEQALTQLTMRYLA